MDWTPFEDRARPVELSQVTIGLDRMRRIEISSDDEAAIGRIFAWLIGQVSLARGEAADAKKPPAAV
jgi:hypothetical protein